MSKHTPGPWYVDTEYPIQIVKHMEHLVGTSKCAEYVVADISEGAFMGEEELANARLIAAAPELLETLEAIREWLTWNDTGDEAIAALRQRVEDTLHKTKHGQS